MTYTTITMPVERLPELIEKLQSLVLPTGMQYGGGLRLEIRCATSFSLQSADGKELLVVAKGADSPEVIVRSGFVDTWLSSCSQVADKANSSSSTSSQKSPPA
jgi:hypothetical protein